MPKKIDESALVKDLRSEVKELRARLKNGDGVARMVNKNLAAQVKALEAELHSTKCSLNMLRTAIDSVS